MSPRGNLSSVASSSNTARNASAPYSRRTSSQPKSSRQQFSACGACRMRRVRCDLKDLPIATAGPHSACSNCKERGIKCVDEFADVKAVKLLRRGRRLQQVEAIYGKTTGDRASSCSSSPPATRLSSIIPNLQPDFFASNFWSWFNVQRPILDSDEFSSRFLAHLKGSQSLGNEGGLIAMLLVVWAASFGLDERGNPESSSSNPMSFLDASSSKSEISINGMGPSDEHSRRERMDKTEAMLREVLELIDFHGIMRRPTLDGVRVLLLILPLLEDSQPLERLAIHEAALSQVLALCSFEGPSHASVSSEFDAVDDMQMRARIFWYAYMQEGITTGLKGGRFVLTQEDLENFHRSLPSLAAGKAAIPSSSYFYPTNSHQPPVSKSMLQLINSLTLPLQLSGVCRKVHTVLTGVKATRRAEQHGLIDAIGMREIWQELDQCWQEFEALKPGFIGKEESVTQQYVSTWQIFIFECHNIIRESLKQYMACTPTQTTYSASSSSRPSSVSANSSPYLPPRQLHGIAVRKCLNLLPLVICNLKKNVGKTGLFHWDAGLVRDGCFFAGYLTASVERDLLDPLLASQTSGLDDNSIKDNLSMCLSALTEMRWALSKSDERVETVKMIWENRSPRKSGPPYNQPGGEYILEPHQNDLQRGQAYDEKIHANNRHSLPDLFPLSAGERPNLPPLVMYDSSRRPDSAPATACSNNGSNASGWASYTPPGTASTTSTGTGLSTRGSPFFPHSGAFKEQSGDSFYHEGNDLDPFSFHAPITDNLAHASPNISPYHHRNSPIEPHALSNANPSGYMGNTYGTIGSAVMPVTHSLNEFNGCPQFGDDCNASYH